MRILDLQLPAGDISWFHTHEWPVLYLTLANSQLRTQNMGEEWGGGAGRGRAGGAADGRGGAGAAAPAGRGGAAAAANPEGRGAAGAANPGGAANPAGRGGGGAATSPRPTSTVSYAERPITHRLQNVGTTLLRAMVVVNETKGGDEAVTPQAMGFSASPELTNKWFRAYRVALSPGETTASHRHQAPVVFLQATAGTGIGRGAMAWEFNEPGQWAFFDAGDTHEIRNTGETRLELIEVELRK
jgi:quercetin dioxygenase-like cupin family protein